MAIEQNGKTFTLKGLAPNSTYIIEVLSVPKDGKPSAWSKPIKFRTNGKNLAPPNITNLNADFKGNTLVVTWDGSDARAEKDFKHFRIRVTSPNQPGITKNYFTDSNIFKFQEDQNRDTFDEYEKTISVTVYSVDRTGNESSGVSITATAPTLEPVTNLQGKWDGRNLTASWEYENPAVNFKSFDIQISNLDETITYYTSTINTQISIGKNSFLGVFTSGVPSSLKLTVIVRNQLLASSLPTTITIEETTLPAPTNAVLTAVPLGYKVSWDAVDDLGYQTTRIYESDSENGTYNFAYTSSTSPVFVPSANFTPRFVKIAHVNYNDTDSPLVATTPKSVTPINPGQIDSTAPGAVTNASAVFDGSTYKLTFDKPIDADLLDFIITLTGTSPDGSSTRTAFLPVSESTEQIFQLTIDENTNFFGSPKNTIVASIKARDLSSNIGESVNNISATFTDNVPMPTNVVFTPGILSYTATWDEPTYGFYSTTRIYESSTQNGTYTLTSYGKTPLIIFTNSSDSRWVKVSHVSTLGQESEKTSAVLVSPINPVNVDSTPPDQRTSISYTAGVGQVTVSWTNPTDTTNNSDVAGVTIRYARISSPSNYTWVDVPFTFTSPITSAIVGGLLPLSGYEFSISTYDKTQNRTAYSTSTQVTTLADTTPPPRPVAPTVSAGAAAGGPMMVRVTQSAIEHGTTTPLPLDTYYFRVFMLNSGFSTAPLPGDATNPNSTEVGLLFAAFNGGDAQEKFFVPLLEGEQRYFYTRAVDTSGNVSDASLADQSDVMVVFSNAYISDLSADKIRAGRINANEYIQVGTTSEQITIKSTSTLGQIYSGVGTYNNSNTGIYIDTAGQFSLKNRLAFDGTNLSLQGSITATGGSFTGNVQLNGGSLYAGTNHSSGQRLILNVNGITGYNSSGSNKFTVTTEGRLTAQLGTIGGWTIDDTTLSSTNLTIDSANRRITFGSSNQLIIGANVGGSGVGGIQIDANDYIYGNGNFSLANGKLSWNSITDTLNVSGSGSFSGEITANSGSITGPLSIGSGGYILIGANANTGTPRVVINNSAIVGYASNGSTPPGDLVEFILTTTPGGSNIAGWSISSGALQKTSASGTIKLDSANVQITAGNSSSTVGIKSNVSGGIAIWAGTQNPSDSSPFYVTNTGDVVATKFSGQGIKLSGGPVPHPVTGRGNVTYSVLSLDGKDILLGASSAGTDGPAKIRWLTGNNVQRATIGHELTQEMGGSNYPNTLVIRAIGDSGTNSTPGRMLIQATGPGATINLDAAGGVTINGDAVETPASVQNRYRNLTNPNQGKPNNITYSTGNPVTASGTTINGDLHFKY